MENEKRKMKHKQLKNKKGDNCRVLKLKVIYKYFQKIQKTQKYPL